MRGFAGYAPFRRCVNHDEGDEPRSNRGPKMIRLRTPLLAVALFTGVAAIGLAPALAQTAPAPMNSTAARNEARHHAMDGMMPGQFVEGRIAFLKAPAQDYTSAGGAVAAGRGG